MPRPLFDLSTIDLDHTEVDTAGVETVNPQRGAMRHLDAIVHIDLEAGTAVARREVRGDEFWCSGHFPERPLLPGVLIVEACAQLSSYFANTVLGLAGKPLLFAGIEDARFRGPVEPGDRLILAAVRGQVKPRLVRFDCQALVPRDGALSIVFTGKILGVPQ